MTSEWACYKCGAPQPGPCLPSCEYRRENMISEVIDIIAGNNLTRYGIYACDENYVRRMSDRQLWAIINH